jgi:hypothetical protein
MEDAVSYVWGSWKPGGRRLVRRNDDPNTDTWIELRPLPDDCKLPDPQHRYDSSPWRDLVPSSVAERQAHWEYRRDLLKIRQLGYSTAEIAAYAREGQSYVAIMIRRAQREPVSPVEKWTTDTADVLVLAGERPIYPRNRRRFGKND